MRILPFIDITVANESFVYGTDRVARVTNNVPGDYNRQFGILTENAQQNGPALSNTYYVDGSKANPPYHHRHHMHLQHINVDLQTSIEGVIIYPQQ